MNSKKIKILVIDDIQDNLISFKALINDIFPDIITITALDGKTGIELAIAEDPDVIFLDTVMPTMNGYNVCELLKTDKRLVDIPVVFITAIRGDKESLIRGLEVGAEAFLAKPIDKSELTAQIRAMIKIKSANKEKKDEKERLASLVEEQTYKIKETHRVTLKLLEDLKKENHARKKSEDALKESNELLSLFLKHSPIYAYIKEVSEDECKVVAASENFDQLIGIPGSKIINKNMLELFPPEFAKKIIADDWAVVTSGKVLRIDEHFNNRNYNTIKFPIFQKNKKLLAGYTIDITDRKLAEETLRESEERYKAISEYSNNAICIVNQYAKIEWINNQMTAISGYTEKQFLEAETFLAFLAPESIQFIITNFAKMLDGMEYEHHYEFYFIHANGSRRLCEKYMMHYYDKQGNVKLIINMLDITERKQAEIDLIKAKEKAEESDRLKSAFLTNMSHEIRTPMNGILGFAGLLKKPNLSIEKQQEYVSIIEKSGVRMLNTISDIIDISKIEAGQMIVTNIETDINELLEYLYNFFRPEIQQKGLHFSYHNSLPTNEAKLFTDKEKIYGILTNLIKNAIKFTLKGSIEFGYEKKDKNIVFYVKDTGVGIREDQKEIIFERFRQGSESLSRNYEGAGLGLSISKAYVEMLGGTIWVESEIHKGTTFYFSIPSDLNKQIESLSNKNHTENIIENQIKKIKILIAEDDELSGILLTEILEKYDKNIQLVKTGIDAIEYCKNNPDIDLVLMDIKMPKMDGYEASKQIRRFNDKLVIIAQTAFGMTSDRDKAIKAGCTDYISKPINHDELIQLINKYFGHQKQ